MDEACEDPVGIVESTDPEEVNVSIEGNDAENEDDAGANIDGNGEACGMDDVDIMRSDDDDVGASSKAASPAAPPHRPVVTEDDISRLQRIVDLVLELGSRISQEHNDDDDEEGAIQEDEVPFERLPDVDMNSNIVHVLNLPPEMNFEVLLTEMGGMPDLVNHCFLFKPTEIKIIFVSVAIANEAKRMLDSLRLHNRTIQAVVSIPDELRPLQPPAPIPPVIGNAVIPPMFMMQPSSARRIGPQLSNVQPGFPMHPYPPVRMPQPSQRRLSHHGPVPPIPILPPSRYIEGQDSHNRHGPSITPRMPIVPFDPHHKMVFGRNVHKREGKSLYEFLEQFPAVCNWGPDQSLEEQQRFYDTLHADHGVTNRYLIVGGLPEGVAASVTSASAWFETYSKCKVEIEICEMGQYATDTGFKDSRFLHLTFQKRGDCTDVYTMFTTRSPELLCKYAAPRKAYDTIWVGNMSEMLSYCKDQDEFRDMCAQLGEMKLFRFLPEKLCCFIGYRNVEDAIRARNRLFCTSFTPVKALCLNVDFTIDLVPRVQRRLRPEYPEPRGRDRDDLSQRLGERLLSALQRRSDGDAVIRQLLDGRESDAVNLLSRNNQRPPPPRSHDWRHGGEHSRVPHSASYERGSWPRPRKRPYYSSDLPPEPYKHRKHDRPRYDSSVAYQGPIKREHVAERPARRPSVSRPAPAPAPPIAERPADPPTDSSAAKPKDPHMLLCDLLKRGKPICKVSAVFVRGDMSHRLPHTLDVNQRANPERLANYLQKKPELSLWQLGADSNDDSVKYDGLCDYLISKNRVALVQEGPYEIYIVPPSDTYSLADSLPDTQFMYAYVLPKGS